MVRKIPGRPLLVIGAGAAAVAYACTTEVVGNFPAYVPPPASDAAEETPNIAPVDAAPLADSGTDAAPDAPAITDANPDHAD